MSETRQIVVPGELVDDTGDLRPGQNTYQEGRNIYALRLGVKSVRGDRVNVIQLSGRYEPFRGDMVIGTVAEVGPSNWYVNIGAANDVGMHVNDVPWRVEFGETSKYLAVGDTVLLKIVHVDEMKKAQVSMKDRQCRKLTGGLIYEVTPAKVPRIVGRQGSMISMIKDATNVRLFVGQNGVIWIDGEPEDVNLALEALQKVEAEAHTTGLTDRMKAWLEERRPSAQRPQREAEPEEEPAEEMAEERPPRRERREREERGERREREGPRGRPEHMKQRRAREEEDEEGEAPIRKPRFADEEERPARRAGREEREERRPARRAEEDEERPPRRERREEREERPRARRLLVEEEEEEAEEPEEDEEEAPRRVVRREADADEEDEDRPARAPARGEERGERRGGDGRGRGSRGRRGGRGGRGGRDRRNSDQE